MHKNQASRILPTVRMALAGGRKTHVHGMPGAGTVPGKGEKAEGEPGEGTDSKYRGSHQNGKGTGRFVWPDGGDPGRPAPERKNCPVCLERAREAQRRKRADIH